MSLAAEGLEAKCRRVKITVDVQESDSLIQLANAIDFKKVQKIVKADLQKTEKGFWWLGRKLYLRIHLGILILQTLLKQTDRGMERSIQQTPIYQVFCGFGILPKWKCPDHTKIETFRNRLSEATHKKVGDYILQIAHTLGFANPNWVDIDSTVQEANMAYPSDATLMYKLAQKADKVINYIKKELPTKLSEKFSLNMKNIKALSKQYLFLPKRTDIKKKREVFKVYYNQVKREISPVIEFLNGLDEDTLKTLPWNIFNATNTLIKQGEQYLKDVAYFIKNHTMASKKLLAFHVKAVACICKGKIAKEKEFGRVFQLGRIGGNFMVAYSCNSIRMEDSENLIKIIQAHKKQFGLNTLESVGTDKKYYSQKNIQKLEKMRIKTTGIQRPMHIKNTPTGDEVLLLRNRRAGIEPLIGHVKEFGLRRSKMKSDKATLSSGYRSVMGFNLHQLIRNFEGKTKILAA